MLNYGICRPCQGANVANCQWGGIRQMKDKQKLTGKQERGRDLHDLSSKEVVCGRLSKWILWFMVWIWEVFFSWQIFFFSLHYSSHCSVQAHGGLRLPSQTGDSLNLKRNPAISHCGISSNVSRSCQAGQCKRKFGQWLVLEPVLVWTSAMPLPRSKVRTWNYVLGNEGSKSTTEEVLVTLSY